MKVAIISSLSGITAKELAEHLQFNDIEAVRGKPWKDGVVDYRHCDWVFSLGCSADTLHKNRLNNPEAVKTCVDKWLTFETLAYTWVPIPRYYNDKSLIPDDVNHLVIRKDRKGNKAVDMEVWNRWEGKPIPYGQIYSEWYDHKLELRVYVFRDQAWVYKKVLNDRGQHEFIYTTAYGVVKPAAIDAAKALKIDYVSFDVLYNAPNNYCFLEANSGSVLTTEVSTAIVEFFINLE
jgi:hypothetical protein